MGVCCIVFDIDGMLFEFFMNFLNIVPVSFMCSIIKLQARDIPVATGAFYLPRKKIKFKEFLFSIFHVFFAFHAISNIKKNIL